MRFEKLSLVKLSFANLSFAKLDLAKLFLAKKISVKVLFAKLPIWKKASLQVRNLWKWSRHLQNEYLSKCSFAKMLLSKWAFWQRVILENALFGKETFWQRSIFACVQFCWWHFAGAIFLEQFCRGQSWWGQFCKEQLRRG